MKPNLQSDGIRVTISPGLRMSRAEVRKTCLMPPSGVRLTWDAMIRTAEQREATA